MFVVYSKESCPFCVKAKQALNYCNFEYEVRDIEKDPEARKFFDENGFKTVPQVFHGDKHIGGYEDVADYLLEMM